MSDFPECEQFKDIPHRYANCRHEREGKDAAFHDKWRMAQGLPPKYPENAGLKSRFTTPVTVPLKSWDASQPSRGLGDVVKKITHATGIDKAVEWVSEKLTGKKEGCGCAKRQQALNEAVPFQ